jgi:hypothetical protein
VVRAGLLKISAGEFGVDEQQARHKLQQYQLPHPRHYVLEIVKAAHLLNASRMEFRQGVDALEVCFDGEAIEPMTVEVLLDRVFASRQTRYQQALRHLAIGLSAASGLGLKEIYVGPWKVMNWHGEQQEIVESVVNRVCLEERPHPRHVTRAVARLFGPLTEEKVLRKRCALARTPILWNGTQVNHGPRLSADALHPVPIETREVSGVVGVSLESDRRQLFVLHNGVLMRIFTAPDPIIGCVGTIDGRSLTMNLSQSDVVEDRAWEAMQAVVTLAALESLIQWIRALEAEALPRWSSTIRRYIARVMAYYGGEPPESEEGQVVFRAFLELVEGLPIYGITGSGGSRSRTGPDRSRHHSLLELRRTSTYSGRTRLEISTRDRSASTHEPVLLLVPAYGESAQTFTAFADDVGQVDGVSEDEWRELERKRSWLGQSWPGAAERLEESDGIRLETDEGFLASLGVDDTDRKGHLFFIVDDVLVDFQELPSSACEIFRNLTVVIDDRRPARTQEDSTDYHTLATMIVEAAPAVLVANRAKIATDAEMVSYMQSLLTGEFAFGLWQTLGLPPVDFSDWQDRSTSIYRLAGMAASAAERDWSRVEARIAIMEEIAEAEVFESLDGRRWPLRRVAAWYRRQDDALLVFVPQHLVIRGRNHSKKVGPKGLFIVGDRRVYEVLRGVFGGFLRRLEEEADVPALVTSSKDDESGATGRVSTKPPRSRYARALQELQRQVGLETHTCPIRFVDEPLQPACRLEHGRVYFNRAHEAVAANLAAPDDPIARGFMISMLITAYCAQQTLTGRVEANYHRALMGLLTGQDDDTH